MTNLAARLAAVDTALLRAEVERDHAQARADAYEADAARLAQQVRAHDVALAAVHAVRDATTARVQSTISDLCSEGLRLVFNDPALRLEARSVERRGVIETDLVLVRGGLETSPLDSNGGGLVAAAAAMLRLVMVRLMSARGLAPLLILDEPLAALSSDRRQAMAQTLYEVSGALGVQVIIVTHESELSALGQTYRVEWEDRDSVLARVTSLEPRLPQR